MNIELSVAYLIRDNPNLSMWRGNPLDRPWAIHVDTAGQLCFDRWDEGTMGLPQPSQAVLEAISPVAEAYWEDKTQSEKPLALRLAENKFLAMCDQLTGSTAHAV